DPNREYKPKVKQWLYRKIFLDEFKTFEYNTCKRHIGDLRRSIESVMIQKKKKIPKLKPPAAPPPQQQQQGVAQDYSATTHMPNGGGPADMTRTGMTTINVVAAPTHTPTSAAPPPYQTGQIMNLGVDTSNGGGGGPSSMVMPGTTTLSHNSLATYMTQQVPHNLLFGIGGQQQQPGGPPPAQQQPLNLQTNHQAQMQPGSTHQHQAGTATTVSGVPTSTAPPIPLNLHNPYYVSLGPMLPISMATPSQHNNHQQHFQQNMLQQHQGIQGTGFQQHTMYQ
ncbi:unnamed protein product, partial [Meganyctiphanes norvegica]